MPCFLRISGSAASAPWFRAAVPAFSAAFLLFMSCVASAQPGWTLSPGGFARSAENDRLVEGSSTSIRIDAGSPVARDTVVALSRDAALSVAGEDDYRLDPREIMIRVGESGGSSLLHAVADAEPEGEEPLVIAAIVQGQRVADYSLVIVDRDAAVNDGPEVSAPFGFLALQAGESPRTVLLDGHFTDPDGESLVFAAVSSAPAVVSVAVSGSVLSVVPVGRGAAEVVVTAADPAGAEASQRFGVRVGDTQARVGVHRGLAATVRGYLAAGRAALGRSAGAPSGGRDAGPGDVLAMLGTSLRSVAGAAGLPARSRPGDPHGSVSSHAGASAVSGIGVCRAAGSRLPGLLSGTMPPLCCPACRFLLLQVPFLLVLPEGSGSPTAGASGPMATTTSRVPAFRSWSAVTMVCSSPSGWAPTPG